MYKLVIFATFLALCSATFPTALHYVAAPHSASRVTKVEWESPALRYVVPAVAPVAPLLTYSHAHTSLVHAPLLHAPLVHHAPVVHHAPLFHHASLLHAPIALIDTKKA